MTRRRKILLGIGVPVLLFVAFMVIVAPQLHRVKETTFRVTVPAATPAEDAIILHIEGDLYPMTRVAPSVYEATVDVSGYDWPDPRRYGYSRGGTFVFGEYGFGINVGGRLFVAGEEALKEDVVTEWRWFPTSPLAEPDVPSEADTRPIAPRDRFWAGPDLIDYWNPAFPHQYNSTIAHMKAQGYEWVQLDPPWDYASVDPPIITDTDVDVPAWPLEDLRKEIRAFKQAGFKVFLGPQVCCTPITFDNRSESWWRSWFDQYTNFLQVHADLVREEGVDAMSFGAPPESSPGERRAPSFAQEGWDGFIAAARSAGVPIGINMHPAPRDGDNLHPPWPQEFVQFAPKVDFISMGMWEWVVDKDDPTLEEIEAGFDEVFRRVDHAHNVTQRPIVFGQVAYFTEHTSARPKGPEIYPTFNDPHANATRYNAGLQARLYESLMRHVADRSYVEGVFPFGYQYLNAPLNLDCDIRDKPAEDVFVRWLKRLEGG